MLRYNRHNLCYPYRNSLALCLWMIPSELHTWFFLSGERIHMGTHENVFFPYADILILYERAPNKIITYFPPYEQELLVLFLSSFLRIPTVALYMR